MSEWTKPSPTINEETRAYWTALDGHEMVVQRCRDCGAIQHYYRAFCAACWSTEVQDVPVSGEGRVWSHSTIWKNRAKGFADEVPYVVAVVELAEGVRVFGNIDAPPEDVAIDLRVRLKFVDTGAGWTFPLFEPIDGRPAA